jgi:hypothetical protein
VTDPAFSERILENGVAAALTLAAAAKPAT